MHPPTFQTGFSYLMTCPMEPPRLRTPGISDCGFGWVSKKFQKQPSSLEYSCSKKNNSTGDDLNRGQEVGQTDSDLLLPQSTGFTPCSAAGVTAFGGSGGGRVVVRCWVVVWSPCLCSHPSSATHQWLSLDMGHLL